jgi:hypothetical protein
LLLSAGVELGPRTALVLGRPEIVFEGYRRTIADDGRMEPHDATAKHVTPNDFCSSNLPKQAQFN